MAKVKTKFETGETLALMGKVAQLVRDGLSAQGIEVERPVETRHPATKYLYQLSLEVPIDGQICLVAINRPKPA
jgi:hypothetical protein